MLDWLGVRLIKLIRHWKRKANDPNYVPPAEEPWTEDDEAAARAYDEWKDAYREACALYEEACKRKDWIEADKQLKRFVALFTPRLEHHHGTSSIWKAL